MTKTASIHVAYIGTTRYLADAERDCCYWSDPERDGSIDEDRANLFEAAPELLEACQAAVFAMGSQGANHDLSHPLRAAWDQCRVAISKAECRE